MVFLLNLIKLVIKLYRRQRTVNVHYERIVQACIDFMNINIMQFREYCARADKQNANFDHYFGINPRFLLM